MRERSFISPSSLDFSAIRQKMKRHAALAIGNDILDKSTSNDVSRESFLNISPRVTASEKTSSTLSLFTLPVALSSVAMTSVNVTMSGDTPPLSLPPLSLHISRHMLYTSTGVFEFIPALINALHATMSGCRPSFFISLNNSYAESHCLFDSQTH